MNEAKRYVEQNLAVLSHFRNKGSRIWGDATSVYEFLLTHGVEYQGTPWTAFRGSGWRRMKPKQCFENSFKKAATVEGLTYCEGFAYAGLISVHHAWCVDEFDRVVDFTWRVSEVIRTDQTEWAYFGVKFDIEKLARFSRGLTTWSVLFESDL